MIRDPLADIRRHPASLTPVLAALVERLLARRSEDRPPAGQVLQHLIGLEVAALKQRRSE